MNTSRLRRITVQYAVSRRNVPHATSLRRWADAAVARAGKHSGSQQLTIRIVGAAESRSLNDRWRDKDKPTNVLSFPADSSSRPGANSAAYLGDLAICAPVVAREAREQAKPLAAHWAHMVVHGVLHLLGYDHFKFRDALRMEALEVEIFAHFGYQDPYLSR